MGEPSEITNPGSQRARAKVVRLHHGGVVTHLQALAAVPLILAASATFAGWLVSEAKSHASGVKEDVATLERKVDSNRIAGDQSIQLVREEMKETRLDIRALSREIRTGLPQQRLTSPPPELQPLTTKSEP